MILSWHFIETVKFSNRNRKGGVTIVLTDCFCSCCHGKEICRHMLKYHLFCCRGTWTWAYNLNHVVRLSCSLMVKLPPFLFSCQMDNIIKLWNANVPQAEEVHGLLGCLTSMTECRDKHGANPVCILCFSLITSVRPWVIFTLSSCRDGTLSQRAFNPHVLDALE